MRKIAIIIAVVFASLSASAQTQEDSLLVEHLKAMTIEQVDSAFRKTQVTVLHLQKNAIFDSSLKEEIEIQRRRLDIIHRRWLFLQKLDRI